MLKVVEMAFDAIIHTTIYKRISAKIKYRMGFCAKIGCFLLQLILESLKLTNFFKSNSEISSFLLCFIDEIESFTLQNKGTILCT